MLYLIIMTVIDGAYIKIGMTNGQMRSRLSSYRTHIPFAQVIAIANTVGDNACYAESKFHKAMDNHGKMEQLYIGSEWFKVTDENIIQQITEKGFRYFNEKLWYYQLTDIIKINKPIYEAYQVL